MLDLIPSASGVTVWLRTESGGTVTLRAPFRPAFAVFCPRLRDSNIRAAAARWGCAAAPVEATEFFSGRTVRAWTVTVPAPPALPAAVRKAESAFGSEALFNADIAVEQRFAFATGLCPLAFARIACTADGTILSSRILDSPRDPDAPRPVLSTARLKVQGTGHPAHGTIRPLEFTADGRTHVLHWDGGAAFLRGFLRLLAAADPDLLVTEHGDDFILPRMLALAARLRMPLPLGRPERPPGDAVDATRTGRDDAAGADSVRRDRARSYVSYGRTVFRASAHTLSGRWHVDARNSFLFAETGLPGLAELARLSGIPLQRLARSSPGTAISAMQVAAAMSRGILVPYKKREPEAFKSGLDLVAADKGGLTYLPRPGLHGNVGELDFASMYPSLMARYNISPETINCTCCTPPMSDAGTDPGGTAISAGQPRPRRGERRSPDRRGWEVAPADGNRIVPADNSLPRVTDAAEGLPVPGIGAHTCARRPGLIPDVLAPVLKKRRLLKERQRTAAAAEERDVFRKRQAALKWILVVCFGFLGYRNARFGRIEAHEAVTAWGREKLLQAKEIAEREGFLFLHGLTDAIWVKKEGASEADYRRLAETVTAETGMPIALEGIYRWIAFLPSKRRPAVAVPNRFAGAFADGTVKARGIALRRTDTPPFVGSVQHRLLERMAKAADPAALRAMLPELREIVEASVLELNGGHVPPEALAISRRLSKAPEEYVADTTAAAVMRELCGRGVALPPGSKIRYLLTTGGRTYGGPVPSVGASGARPGADRARSSEGGPVPPVGATGGRPNIGCPRPSKGGRALGFLDGGEVPDLSRYEAMLREAAEELLGPLAH